MGEAPCNGVDLGSRIGDVRMDREALLRFGPQTLLVPLDCLDFLLLRFPSDPKPTLRSQVLYLCLARRGGVDCCIAQQRFVESTTLLGILWTVRCNRCAESLG